jgi:hypothetical protein
MKLRYRFVLPLTALCLGLAVGPALAAKPSPVATARPAGMPTHMVGLATTTSPTCTLGQPDAALLYGPFFLPPDDRYYTFIDPATCGCPFGVLLSEAHWKLFWPQTCQIPVEITLVGAVETNPGSGCYIPNDSDQLGTPIAATLTGTVAGTEIDHSFSVGWPCLTKKAFISFRMINNGDCPTDVGTGALESPRAESDNTPDNCVSYNSFPGSPGPLDMVDPSFGFLGNITMWVVGSCCPEDTPTLPGTWGRVKTLYR